MGLYFIAAVRGKETSQIPGQRMLEFARGAELAKVAELFFYFCIERPETDFIVRKACDFAARKNVDSKIYGDCAGMKEVQRSKVESAAGQVNPAGRVGNDRTGRRQSLFRIELGHLAELVVTAI